MQYPSRGSAGGAILLALVLSVYSLDRAQAIYVRTEPGDRPNYCTVFHHMVKSAGSTVKHILNRAAAKDGIPRPAICTMGRDPKCMDGLMMSPVIVGYGELIREPLNNDGRQCEYFTMMRHPVDRIVSMFFYCPTDHDIQQRPSKYCGYSDHPDAATERLLEFAQQHWGNQAFRQMILGLYCPPNAPCEPSPERRPTLSLDHPEGAHLLQQAQGILSTYAAVGIVEHMDISKELFNARVRSHVQDWTVVKDPINPGVMSDLRDDVLAWAKTSPELLRTIEADLQLYDFSVQLFKNQTTQSLGTAWSD